MENILQNFLPRCICAIIVEFVTHALKLNGALISWETLSGQYIQNFMVVLSNFGDIHPYANPIFQKCEELFLDRCDKNFVGYWLKQKTFPNLKKIFVGSHPRDWSVLANDWIINNHIQVLLIENYFDYYKTKKWSKYEHIQRISTKDYYDIVNSFESQTINSFICVTKHIDVDRDSNK